eukprot:6143885-Alexandrium_andersonii.AAC.1
MSASLVGSEMCIRDSSMATRISVVVGAAAAVDVVGVIGVVGNVVLYCCRWHTEAELAGSSQPHTAANWIGGPWANAGDPTGHTYTYTR